MQKLSERNKKYLLRTAFGLLILFGVKIALELIITSQLNKQVNSAIAKIDPTFSLRSNNFTFRVLNPGFIVRGVSLYKDNRLAVEIESTRVSLGSWSELISIAQTSEINLSDISVSIDGLGVYLENLDEKAKVLGRSLGLFNLTGSLALNANINSTNGSINLESLKIDFKELFSLSLGLQLQGIDFKIKERLFDALEASGIKVEYYDRSMMGRAMNLETFPEFVELKKNMTANAPQNEQNIDFSKRVTLSAETNKKVTRLFMDYLLRPNLLKILQEKNKSIQVKNFLGIYLEKPKDLSEILGQMGLQILIDSQVYL